MKFILLFLFATNSWGQILTFTGPQQRSLASVRVDRVSIVCLHEEKVVLVVSGATMEITPAVKYFTSIEQFANPLGKKRAQILLEIVDGAMRGRKIMSQVEDLPDFFAKARDAVDEWRQLDEEARGKLGFGKRSALLNPIREAYRHLVDQQSESLQVEVEAVKLVTGIDHAE